MRRKVLLITAVCIVALIAAAFFMWDLLQPQIPRKYDRNVVRNVDNSEEESALTVAENINYSAILSQERFDGSTDPNAYLHPGTYLEYTYANFIDSKTLDYYEMRYDDLQGKGDPKQIGMTYEANVQNWTQIRVFNSPAPENVTWYNTTVVFSGPDGSVLLKNSGFGNDWGVRYFYKNQSGYQMLKPEFDLSFPDCYVIEMKLSYSEIYAPLAAFYSDVNQIVVLDHTFEPVLIGVEAQNLVS